MLHTASSPLQAASTDQIVSSGSDGSNGSNGNGNGSGGQPPVVIGDLAAVQASLEAKYQSNGNGSNGSHSNGNGSSNGAGGRSAVLASVDAAAGVDGYMEPELAGHLETAAQVGGWLAGWVGGWGRCCARSSAQSACCKRAA
jgi:hypothetical protein